MKIGVLTSSRADFGIYFPLLEALNKDAFFDLEIIIFGTHLSKFHGYTADEILKNKYPKTHKIASLLIDDNQESIATSYGLTVIKFAAFWNTNQFDLVLCLGDRFEMSAAVQAGIPFGVRFAHFHGGETTLGAIDNVYRHQITLASKIHFTATQSFSEKVCSIVGSSENVYNVGALSLADIENFVPIEKEKLLNAFQIPNQDFVLTTFHPETVDVEENVYFAESMKQALATISKKINVVVTMPNADTLGSVYREKLYELKAENNQNIFLIENFGKKNYFSAMYHSKLLLGNTSSGILEAASFKKNVINVGNRQKGRLQSANVEDSDFECNQIIQAFEKCFAKADFNGENVYYKKNTVSTIIEILKKL